MTLSPIITFGLLQCICLSAFFIYIAFWSRHRKAGFDNLDLLGMPAIVNTALEPEGAVILDGELWRALAKHPAKALLPGHTVRVVGVAGHYLVVEPT